ncbi:YggU family protein [Candidatus Woesearchaeota archaeon]|nr:YggU family protein [Candidatus Woesearchaeota archaeon]
MIDSYIKNNTLKILVKPNSPKNEIIAWDNEKQALKVSIKAPPEKGKANTEVIKFFSKLLKKKILIHSGKTSRTKVLRIQ